MRQLIQRVKKASVLVEGKDVGTIGQGLLVFLGIEEADDESDVQWLVRKALRMRIFDDEEGVMNLSSIDIGAQMLIVSQFTLHASTKKGNRPSYIRAADPSLAENLYEHYLENVQKEIGDRMESGIFGADMKVRLINDGPVTIFMDSKNRE